MWYRKQYIQSLEVLEVERVKKARVYMIPVEDISTIVMALSSVPSHFIKEILKHDCESSAVC